MQDKPWEDVPPHARRVSVKIKPPKCATELFCKCFAPPRFCYFILMQAEKRTHFSDPSRRKIEVRPARGGRGRRKSVDSQNGDKVGSFVQFGVEERFMFSDRKSRAKHIQDVVIRRRVNKTGKRRLSFWMDVYWLCTYARVGERVPN